MPTRPYVLLDRDGTVIRNVPYLSNYLQVCIPKDVIAGLKFIKSMGFAFGIISNQSGIGRGFISPKQLIEVNSQVVEVLESKEIHIDFLLCCTHHPNIGCNCRKPRTGLLENSIYDKVIDKESSFMVGDTSADIDFALNYGVTPILLSNESPSIESRRDTLTAKNFMEVALLIQEFSRNL